MKRVVIGLLGPTLDAGKREKRWERWRPSVAVCQQQDLHIDRFEMLHQPRYRSLAERIRDDIAGISPGTEVRLHPMAFSDPWDFEDVFAALHEYACAYPFNPDDEDYLVHITTGTHVAQICLFLLTEARYFPASLIQTAPEQGQRADVAGTYRIIDLDLSKYDRIASRFQQRLRDDISFLKSGIETRNQSYNRLIERVEHVAANSAEPMLLLGPTGAGKSRLARRIYELKQARRRLCGQFVEINCATIRGDAAMSALFGHVKGAFTGALSSRKGALRTADKGMLFLDEVGELGTDEQAMLLRALEEKRFTPLGADAEVSSDFQLICGTNRDLRIEVGHGRFREDLLARIDLWTFALPGLKDRPEDIEPNIDFELERLSAAHGRQITINREARDAFLRFAVSPEALWSANFRDLNGAVIRMATLSGGRITRPVVNEETERLRAAWRRRGGQPEHIDVGAVEVPESVGAIDLFDRLQLGGVLDVCRESHSLSEAGRTLFAVSRSRRRRVNDADRLRKYLARFGLTWMNIPRDRRDR